MKATITAIKEELRPLAAVTVGLMVITAVVYPLAVTGIGQVFFNREANGSLTRVDGDVVGSTLVGQPFESGAYFHGRPSSAGDGYDAANSSGSNLGPTSAKLINGDGDDPLTNSSDKAFAGLAQRAAAYRAENGLAPNDTLPSDAVTASASGLDPHISPANARLQAARVATARGVSEDSVLDLVQGATEKPFLGFIGTERVNVLKLNLALNQRFPVPE